ncbi:unnamed protein product [Allacma fusca]|uniref:CRAL-TRIO domain-containing protein n=1 Tax=Allacma fusca TaxID=39272 RepID=A0A8J2KWB6_9HEXA|nr:unnamed protein product [Allacma fusca]
MSKKFCLLLSNTIWILGISGNVWAQSNNLDLVSIIFQGEDLDAWDPPRELQNAFPYYLSGFDEECRPIWVGLLGRWDLSKFISKGESSAKAMEKFIHQAAYRFATSIKNIPSGCEPVSGVVIIYDADGFNYRQITSGETISFVVNACKVFVPLVVQYFENVYFVNTNFMFKGLLAIARPIMGSLMERVEVYGSHKATWVPKLLKKLPRDQLPPTFGGNADFKPIKTYGSYY